jgi:hypothetical protein
VRERDQDVAGDYGYDLAHEEIGRVTAPDDTTGHTTGDATGDPHGSASQAAGKDEPSADLGYDEAHGF